MRLCHIVHGYEQSIGGVEVYVQKLNEALIDQTKELEIHILYPADESGETTGTLMPGDHGRVVLHTLDKDQWHSANRLQRIRYIWKRFAELDARYDFDLYHHHSPFDVPLLFGAGGLILRKKPVMFTMYGGIDSLKELSRSNWKYLLIKQIARVIFSRSHCTGNCQAAEIIYQGQPFHNIGMAVDLETIKATLGERSDLREQFGVANRCVVIYPSRIAEDKGQIDAIRAVELLRERIPKIALFLIGPCKPDEEGYLATLKQYIQSRGLQDTVKILGFVSSPDLMKWYRTADILLFTSFHEGLPFVILEAASMELPIIASSVGGIPEIIQHGENGFLVQPRDVDGYADSIEALIEDEDLRKRFGQEAQKRVGRLISFEHIAATCLEHYAKILQTKIQ
jgi:glycosyltransferase involved in cell wall biosynthesis